MDILSIIKAALSFANWLAKYAHDRQLLTAGEYKAIAESNEQAIEKILRAAHARRNVSNDAGVRDDKYNRNK